MPMPLALCTLLKFPPSAQVLKVRQFSAIPLTPAHQKEDVTCWIQTLFTTQFVPEEFTAPLLSSLARLTALQSSDKLDTTQDSVVKMLAIPCVLPAGVTR